MRANKNLRQSRCDRCQSPMTARVVSLHTGEMICIRCHAKEIAAIGILRAEGHSAKSFSIEELARWLKAPEGVSVPKKSQAPSVPAIPVPARFPAVPAFTAVVPAPPAVPRWLQGTAEALATEALQQIHVG